MGTATIAAAQEMMNIKRGHNLAARLNNEGEGGFGDCWNALFELKSCANEIVLFFLNGEGYIGQECCRSIRIITRQCWPSMFISLGFTAEEGNILRGHCDASPAVPSLPLVQPPLGSSRTQVVAELRKRYFHCLPYDAMLPEWPLNLIGLDAEGRRAEYDRFFWCNAFRRSSRRSKPSIPMSKFVVFSSLEEISSSGREDECSVRGDTVNSVKVTVEVGEANNIKKVLGEFGIRRDKRVDSVVPKVQRAHEKRAMAEEKARLTVDDVLSIPPPAPENMK
ncbi:hypothetical protein GIB67_031162 [Kingdonia uniflora]|uniref:Prolamin-like domain-containing protein n=1 Tax=Kingdonia uniflora TaxID=39325 RepID=A0A7J7NK19_9MAGN|nr:hypothetical protein GIB67_031162 [Kingdonia uniflora]